MLPVINYYGLLLTTIAKSPKLTDGKHQNQTKAIKIKQMIDYFMQWFIRFQSKWLVVSSIDWKIIWLNGSEYFFSSSPIPSLLLFPGWQEVICFNAKLKILEHRQQRIAEVKAKYEWLMRELEVTKQYLMLDPNKWLSECKGIVLLPGLIGVLWFISWRGTEGSRNVC